jgi:hypothetical protein
MNLREDPFGDWGEVAMMMCEGSGGPFSEGKYLAIFFH